MSSNKKRDGIIVAVIFGFLVFGIVTPLYVKAYNKSFEQITGVVVDKEHEVEYDEDGWRTDTYYVTVSCDDETHRVVLAQSEHDYRSLIFGRRYEFIVAGVFGYKQIRRITPQKE